MGDCGQADGDFECPFSLQPGRWARDRWAGSRSQASLGRGPVGLGDGQPAGGVEASWLWAPDHTWLCLLCWRRWGLL